ncbi:MAG TPA: hypothetical protein VGO86_02555 [Candidatus Dormibacteraeota bacterium]
MHRAVDRQLPSSPLGQVSVLGLARRQLDHERASATGLAIALVLALLPAALLFVESSGTRSDLRTVAAASYGVIVHRADIRDRATFDAFQQQVRRQVDPRLAPYTDGGNESATAGPFRIDSTSAGPPSPAVAAADVQVSYAADLAARVDALQGVLPNRADGTSSMAQAVADRAGIRLFDTVCVRVPSAPPGATPWCTRVVSLWRPATAADAGLAAATAPLQLFTDREAYFGVLGAAGPQHAEASRQYRPHGDAVAAVDGATVQARVREATAAIQAAHIGDVRSSLNNDLQRYAAARDAVRFPIRLLTVALIPLLLLLVGAVARWYVDLRLQHLALLRARGWSRSRVQSVVLAQFGTLGAVALGLALLAGLGFALRAEGGPAGLVPVAPSPGQLVAIAAAVGVPVVAAATFIGLARWASRQRMLRLEHPETRDARTLSWRGTELNGLLIVPAALLLLSARLAGTERWLPPGTLGDVGALLVSVAGLVMLVVAVLPAMSLVAELSGRRRAGVEGTLAQWQLRRWWQRHATAGFLLVLAFAIASFTAVALATQLLNPASTGTVLGPDVGVSLAVGFACAIVAALLTYGLAFLLACRARTDDYTALLVDGLPAPALRRSVAIEQHTVLVEGLLVGVALGLVLAWTDLHGVRLDGQALASAPTTLGSIAGVGAAAVTGLAAGATAGWLVRRASIGYHLVAQGRSTT